MDRFTMSMSARLKKWPWLLSILFASVFVVLVLSLGMRQVKIQSQKDLKNTLTTVLRSTQGGLRLWKEDLKTDHFALARLPKVHELITNQILHPGNAASTSERFQNLQTILQPWISDHSYLGFSVFKKNKDGTVHTLFGPKVWRKKLYEQFGTEINQALAGSFALSQPVILNTPEFLNSGHENKVVMIAVTPVKGENGETIAALMFSINAYGAFSEMTQLGRLGESGETYAVDKNGQMVTRSRFVKTLKDQKNLPEVRDPTHLFEFTHMAQSLRSGTSGVNLKGYTDYRGVKVVGAWLWDQDLGLGLATEINKDEAYRSYEMTQKMMWLMIAVLLACMLALLFFRESRTRNLRKIYALEQSDQARKDLLAVVSHDLKNPLSSLLLTNELLLKTLPPDCDFTDKRKKLLIRNNHAAAKMKSLITDLLDSAKIEAGKLKIYPKKCVAAQVLEQTLELYEQLAEEKSIEIIRLLPQDLPPIWADSERLSQIFSNIVGNALKFSDVGGKVTISAQAEGKEVIFSIIDQGVGMPVEDLMHLFERYWQAKKTQSFGTGLGLTICKELVSAHGGRIWAESEVGIGTKFHFTLAVYDNVHGQNIPKNRAPKNSLQDNNLDS